MLRLSLALKLALAAARGPAAAGKESAPSVDYAVGFHNGDCESHPHAGVELRDGGWLMVGDSVCWDGSAAFDRALFVVVAEADGDERWSQTLGDIGFNYGKYGTELSDGTLLVLAGVASGIPRRASSGDQDQSSRPRTS